ncbi:MAG: BolA/IbaG family iron-sulfur metabolism protein [Gammaproteobacteria bacterium]|nr:MAG: BolA/IbaG family iron-sulfur metabolism protein [Gammaproteobacteria bacterium]
MTPDDVKALIEKAIPDSEAIITGEGCNLSATVISNAFESKTPVQEQKMVYAAVNHLIASGELHALGIRAYTPAEWEASQVE